MLAASVAHEPSSNPNTVLKYPDGILPGIELFWLKSSDIYKTNSQKPIFIFIFIFFNNWQQSVWWNVLLGWRWGCRIGSGCDRPCRIWCQRRHLWWVWNLAPWALVSLFRWEEPNALRLCRTWAWNLRPSRSPFLSCSAISQLCLHPSSVFLTHWMNVSLIIYTGFSPQKGSEWK